MTKMNDEHDTEENEEELVKYEDKMGIEVVHKTKIQKEKETLEEEKVVKFEVQDEKDQDQMENKQE